MLATEWNAYIDRLRPLAENAAAMVEGATEQERQELYEYFFTLLSVGYISIFHTDPAHPDFSPLFNNAFDHIFPNPDTSYQVAPIDDGGTYILSGFRGTTRMVDVQIGGGMLVPRGEGGLGQNFANYYLDDLTLAEDGAFEVLISADRPADHVGDWWKLENGATYLLVRQTVYDALTEVDARVAIDRLDTPAAKPRPTAEVTRDNLEQLSVWTDSWVTWIWGFTQRSINAHPIPNRFIVNNFDDIGGVGTQHYIEGRVELADGEALFVETEVPESCVYWGFQMVDKWLRTIDEFSQTSINGHTAILSSDGKLRFVVSDTDPGVPNWLDTVGRNEAYVQGRWNICSSGPAPVAMRIPVADVREHMPADTPTVSAEERDAALRLRRKGIQLRRRW